MILFVFGRINRLVIVNKKGIQLNNIGSNQGLGHILDVFKRVAYIEGNSEIYADKLEHIIHLSIVFLMSGIQE
jgi:hypothetical protein